MPEWSLKDICTLVPIVDNGGCIVATRSAVLVPAKGSQWAALLGKNPWRDQNYVELGDDYMSAGTFSGDHTYEDQFLSFIKTYMQATDVPFLVPPDAGFPDASSPLTMENALLLLEWIDNLRSRGVALPQKFLNCIMCGSWLKTSVGYWPPSESFKEVLGTLGVKFEFAQAMSYIGKRFMSMATRAVTGDKVLSLLQFIRFLGYRCPAESILFSSEWTIPSEVSCLPFIDIDFHGNGISNYKSELELLGVLVRFKQNYQIIVDNFKFPTGSVTSGAAILLLKCIRFADSCDKLVQGLKKRQWLKTNAGFRAPRETFLLDTEWKCLITFTNVVPLLDFPFYGDEILSYREELRKIGVVASLEQVSNAVTGHLKQLLSTSSLTKEIRLTLLSCYKELNKEHKTFPANILNFMRTEKWLHTTHGFRSPKNCALFDCSWEPVMPVASLPFIDDSDSGNGAGKEIYSYKEELKALGVAVDFNRAADFVLSRLTIAEGHEMPTPTGVLGGASLRFSDAGNTSDSTDRNMEHLIIVDNPSLLLSSTLTALLKCMARSADPGRFAQRIGKMQIKTTIGYRYADECILYDSTWSSYFHREDGPFIDEAFYGPEISSYTTELRLIGVVLGVGSGCALMAQNLKNFSRVDAISRIYRYLAAFKWKPTNGGENWIWIPRGRSGGKWVRPADCVLHDRNELFSERFCVLDEDYGKDLFVFFFTVLGVRHSPRVLDHCILWRSWECTNFELTPASCSVFWEFIGSRWNATTAKLLSGSVTRVPVLIGDKIILREVEDVFVPDDLLLKHLFDRFSPEPMFVWYPARLPFASRAKMDSVYQSVGVRAISKAVKKDESCISNLSCCQVVEADDAIVTPGLLRIILAFLASPFLDIPAEKRHRMACYLLGMRVLEMTEPITVSYQVELVSSGRMVTVEGRRMFRWEKEDRKLYMQRSDKPLGRTTRMEFATGFAEEISQGLLYERVDLIPSLTDLLKIGFLVDFEEDEVEFLLKTKNLQLFPEDADFLLDAFLHNDFEVRG